MTKPGYVLEFPAGKYRLHTPCTSAPTRLASTARISGARHYISERAVGILRIFFQIADSLQQQLVAQFRTSAVRISCSMICLAWGVLVLTARDFLLLLSWVKYRGCASGMSPSWWPRRWGAQLPARLRRTKPTTAYKPVLACTPVKSVIMSLPLEEIKIIARSDHQSL